MTPPTALVRIGTADCGPLVDVSDQVQSAVLEWSIHGVELVLFGVWDEDFMAPVVAEWCEHWPSLREWEHKSGPNTWHGTGRLARYSRVTEAGRVLSWTASFAVTVNERTDDADT